MLQIRALPWPARYRCFGDGLCCTDIHAVGPLTKPEIRRLDVIAPEQTRMNDAIGGVVVTPIAGGCAHLTADGCRVHAALGLAGKPGVCRRFPYRLVSTPLGKRISTEHRCPCRTLGERPVIDPADALVSVGARLGADVIVGKTIRWTRSERIAFASYVEREREILAQPLSLDAEPFPDLEEVTWVDVAHHYRGKIDGSACGQALAWFGDIVLSLHGHEPRRLRDRPWSPAFDRAEARTPVIEGADTLFADWIADEIWGLEWTERGTFADARRDLVTRLAVAREMARRLMAEGVREDRAAAEAVLVGEMAGAAPLFQSVVRAFR